MDTVSETPDTPRAATRGRTSSRDLPKVLLKAARKILESRGMRALTIRAVAAKANVAPMSVYNYFGDKQGLLDALAEKHFADLIRRLRTIAETDPVRRLSEASNMVYKIMTRSPYTHELMRNSCPGEKAGEAFELLVGMIRQGQQAGVFIDTDPYELAATVWACLQGAIFIEVQDARAMGPAKPVSYTRVVDTALRGISRS